jgi:hypothetical protein
MRLVNDKHAAPARMVAPSDDGYLLLAAEVEWRGPFRSDSPAKRHLLARAKDLCAGLAGRDDVVEATLFRAVLVAPGEGTALIKERGTHRARYDVVVLVLTTSVDTASRVRDDAGYQQLSSTIRGTASATYEIVARNAVRLGDVDHRPNHVFLFNYFYADDTAELLPVFEYTAGWFQAKTNLPNSTLLQPVEGEAGGNRVINHASWPNFRTFLPSLVLRPTFRSFVLANFKANHIAAQPILYRRV